MYQRNSLTDLVPVGTGTQSATYRVAVDISQYANFVVQLTYDASFIGTLKVYGSLSSTQPDVSSALSLSNKFVAVALLDMDASTIVAGSTGVVVTAGAIGSKLVDVQSNTLKWAIIEVTRTAGSFVVDYMKSSNQ